MGLFHFLLLVRTYGLSGRYWLDNLQAIFFHSKKRIKKIVAMTMASNGQYAHTQTLRHIVEGTRLITHEQSSLIVVSIATVSYRFSKSLVLCHMPVWSSVSCPNSSSCCLLKGDSSSGLSVTSTCFVNLCILGHPKCNCPLRLIKLVIVIVIIIDQPHRFFTSDVNAGLDKPMDLSLK